MGILIVSTFATLDGVQENPQDWSLDYWSAEYGRLARDQLFGAEALLMGRVTYEAFSAVWPTIDDTNGPTAGYADRMNSIRKYVVSATLAELEWTNAELLTGDLVDAVAELTSRHSGTLLAFGSGGVARALAQAGLVDEFRVWVHPLVVGRGAPTFSDWPVTRMELVSRTSLPKGVEVLSYRPGGNGD